MNMQRSGTETIEFHILPSGNGTHTRTHTHTTETAQNKKSKTARAESQGDSSFPADGHQAILNKMNTKSKTNKVDEH